jgi:hypothetical protein
MQKFNWIDAAYKIIDVETEVPVILLIGLSFEQLFQYTALKLSRNIPIIIGNSFNTFKNIFLYIIKF